MGLTFAVDHKMGSRPWGYYDYNSKCYSLLPKKYRMKNLDEIPDCAFKEPSRDMPEIPDGDGEKFQPPCHDDLGELP